VQKVPFNILSLTRATTSFTRKSLTFFVPYIFYKSPSAPRVDCLHSKASLYGDCMSRLDARNGWQSNNRSIRPP
jgi:hypothetical protein